MYLYPRLSPNYRQVQVDVEFPNKKTFPNFDWSLGQQILLNEGEVLYLPPFWFHQVESVSSHDNQAVISLNVWTESQEQLVMDRIYGSDLFLPFTRENQTKAAVLIWTEMISNRIAGTDFLRKLHESRYAPIFGTASRSPKLCPIIEPEDRARLEIQHQPSLEHFLQAFEMRSQGVREIHLGNYIEDLLDQTLGVELVNDFLGACADA
eukprot:TRINITY_DN9861_c0_g1_i1.p2 TRINITY_DN9861_c0_g1~~TRINITY_DN9861_c0_g1_i1.p2  ORF type:complete len:208 (-),score=38.71 TRINITY_DN9861_c0_g1_i1:26-649(-)